MAHAAKSIEQELVDGSRRIERETFREKPWVPWLLAAADIAIIAGSFFLGAFVSSLFGFALPPEPNGAGPILIAVTADNDVAYDGKIIGIPGVSTVVKQALKDNKDMPVIIQADQEANAGLFIRIIDEAKLAGATKVSVATSKQAT